MDLGTIFICSKCSAWFFKIGPTYVNQDTVKRRSFTSHSYWSVSIVRQVNSFPYTLFLQASHHSCSQDLLQFKGRFSLDSFLKTQVAHHCSPGKTGQLVKHLLQWLKQQVTYFCEGNHDLINQLGSCRSEDFNPTPYAGGDLLSNFKEA